MNKTDKAPCFLEHISSLHGQLSPSTNLFQTFPTLRNSCPLSTCAPCHFTEETVARRELFFTKLKNMYFPLILYSFLPVTSGKKKVSQGESLTFPLGKGAFTSSGLLFSLCCGFGLIIYLAPEQDRGSLLYHQH